jgi:hypothetical protein
VTVTCCVVRKEGLWWWLTRETGKLPTKCESASDLEDPCECCSSWKGTHVPIRSFFVLRSIGIHSGKVHSLVAIALLTQRALEVVVHHLLPYLCEVSTDADELIIRDGKKTWFRRMADLYESLEMGLFSSKERCSCSPTARCGSCVTVSITERLFVCQKCFDKPFPLGPRHWWTGATDAAGMVEVRRGRSREWLECIDGYDNLT